MTFAIDRDAAIAFTRASISTPSVKKFLNVSYLASRHSRPAWWTDDDWKAYEKVNYEVLPNYFKAKVAADDVLTILSKDRYEREEKDSMQAEERFCGISLRPGNLTEEPVGGVKMGRIGASGKTSRATVAESIVQVLEKGARGWVDVLDGEEQVGDAVGKLVREGFDAVEGEDLGEMRKRVEGQ
jgi:hypothetical protein